MIKILLMALSGLVMTEQVFAWGQTGHRTSGEIAERYLSPKAKLAIQELLGSEDLAEASTYADEMRSNPSEFWQKTASPWHYVNVHEGKRYKQAPPEGDAVSALAKFAKTLKDPKASREAKQLALRFTVHIIGDLHQPFHSGTSEDLGGNRIRVNFFGEDSNIHRVWDSGLIDRQQLSYSEWSKRLSRTITPEQLTEWQQTDPKTWIAESVEHRLKLYPNNERLSWSYQYSSMPIVKQRLQMAGIRIATYLNHLFAS